MAMDMPLRAVQERLVIAMATELEIAKALASVPRDLDQGEKVAEVDRLESLVQAHVAALAALGPYLRDPSPNASVDTAGGPAEAVTCAERSFSATTQAYGALHATARVLYEPDLCDLAERHLADHIDGLGVMARLLPAAVAAELNADGLFCRCICPSCSIGACGCVRSSLSSIADAWGWPGLEPIDGVELRSPPRPGSQLAAAGVHQRDRVLSVDGEIVRSLGDQQAALRKHPPGEMAQLTVQRPTGELVKVPVTR